MQKTLLTLFFIILIASCQKKNEYHQLKWTSGDPEANLKPIHELDFTDAKSSVLYKGQRIEFLRQRKGSLEIEDTFLKKISDEKRSLKALDAKYIDFLEVKSLTSKTEKFSAVTAFENLQKTFPKKIKAHHFSLQYKKIGSHVQKVLGLEYELADGTLWKSYHDLSGNILFYEPLGSQFEEATDTNIQVFQLGPKLGPLVDVSYKNLSTTPTISNKSVYVDSEATKKVSEILPNMKFDTKDERFDQIQVFHYLDKAQSWIRDHLQVNFNRKLEAVVNVGFPEKTNTAFYYQNKIRLGRGDDVTYSMLASDPSIVYHESFHAMIDSVARLPFQNEGGSLNEGFADFFTCVALNRPYLGESSYLKGPYKRTVALTRTLQEKNGGLYFDSQIISSLLWEVKEKLGKEKALSLAMDILADLSPVSDFSDFNKSFIKVSNQHFKSTELEIVINILKSRGFLHE